MFDEGDGVADVPQRLDVAERKNEREQMREDRDMCIQTRTSAKNAAISKNCDNLNARNSCKDSCVVLCADVDCVRHPEVMGLDGEDMVSKGWMSVVCDAREARDSLSVMKEVAEVWVFSCDGASPINLCAAIKQDSQEKKVYLISSEKSGSLLSRASSAGIDGVLGIGEFVDRYNEWKGRNTRRDVRADNGAKKDRVCKKGSLVSQACEIVEQNINTSGFSGPVRVGCVDELGNRVDFGEFDGACTHESESADAGEMDLQMSRADVSNVASASQSFLLPIVSASGGSGKSTIAALTALIAHQSGMKTLLLDFDLQFGDMVETVGAKEAMHVEDLIEAPMRIQHIRPTEEMPAILSIPRNLELSEQVEKQLPELLDLLLPNFDMIVVNTGSYWSDEHAVLLERCSRALFLVDQRPASLRACQRALSLCARCGIATSPLIFAINKCSKQGLYSSIDVSCALHGATTKELMWGGVAVEEYLAAGQAVQLLNTHNALVASLGALLLEIVPNMPQSESVCYQSQKPSLLQLFKSKTGIE